MYVHKLLNDLDVFTLTIDFLKITLIKNFGSFFPYHK